MILLGLAAGGCRARWKSRPSAEATSAVAPASQGRARAETDQPETGAATAAPTASPSGSALPEAKQKRQVASFAQVGFAAGRPLPEEATRLAQAAANAALTVLHDRPPADAVAEAASLLELSPLTSAGLGTQRPTSEDARLDAIVFDSLAGFGSVTLFDPGHSPANAALQLVRKPGLSVSGWNAFRELQLPVKPFPQEALSQPTGTPDAGSPGKPGPALRGAVSVLLRTGDGRFAGALSYRGGAERIAGELSSLSQPGASIHCGPLGAVSVTWANATPAEPIARLAYERLSQGEGAQMISEWVVQRWGDQGALGVAVMTQAEISTRTNSDWVFANGFDGAVH